jgi:CheY-like chemotaxis protein
MLAIDVAKKGAVWPFGRSPPRRRVAAGQAAKGKAVPRILVADDNTNIQKMVALAFEERGIDVVSVGNGEAAVRRIPDLAPDLVLADVFMPVRNGYEVCEFIKRDDRFSHVPVILLVGAFDPLDEKEARRVGADGVLKKPFVPPDPLIAMVTSALEKNPRIAAQVAKAREVPVPHAPQPAVASAPNVLPSKETTPLPEFPQPAPEEDAEMYGFGKGRDRMGDDDTAEASPPKDEAAINTALPAEEFDELTTATDWRRNAANFEVPEELGGKMAFAAEEAFNSSAFPAETHIPPISSPVTHGEKTPGVAQQPEVEAQVSSRSGSQHLEDKAESQAAPAQSDIPPQEDPSVEAASWPPWESAQPKKSGFDASTDSISAPSEYAEGGWMSKIFRTRPEEKAEKKDEANSLPQSALGANASTESESSHVASISAQSEEKPFVNDSHPTDESWLAPPPPPVLSAHFDPHPVPDFFSPSHPDDSTSPPADAGSFSEPEPDLHAAPLEALEPPSVPDREQSGPPTFGRMADHTEPMHSFLSAPPLEPSADQAHFEKPSMSENFNTSPVAPSESPSVMNAADERIPTALPPNPDALADIPFLVPPPPGPGSKRATPEDSPSVDAVVAKVLEKLEPQLLDLLSQGLLKPLVENLLHQELEKKGK